MKKSIISYCLMLFAVLSITFVSCGEPAAKDEPEVEVNVDVDVATPEAAPATITVDSTAVAPEETAPEGE